jgi:prepilin-type N-terminal cleavage/methylation domain-containing protein
MRRRRQERGFTLVEVMVAIALTASVVSVLFAGIGVGFKGMARIDAGAERLERRRQIDFLLRRQIGAAYPAAESRPTESTFGGTQEAMNFLAVDSATGPGFYRVWVALETAEGEHRLVMTRHAIAAGSVVGFERSVLAQGVAEFRLSYFGAQPPNEEPRWHDRWEGQRGLPSLVRVHLRLADERQPAAPDAVIRLWTAERAL